MKSGIHILQIWSDDDLVELEIRVSDGTSCFSNKVYVGHSDLDDAVTALKAFKDQTRDGLLDLRFGRFGPEYANGALHAQFHFAIPGRLFVSCELESMFEQFGNKQVASMAKFFLQSEPALLDRFIVELRALSNGNSEEAFLEAV